MSVHSVHPLRETGELVLKKGMEKDGKKRGSIFFVFLCVPGNALKMRRKSGTLPAFSAWVRRGKREMAPAAQENRETAV